MRFSHRKNFVTYLSVLSSKGPYGGGSAAALTAALGAALVLKALRYTGNTVSASPAQRLKEIARRFQKLQDALAAYADKDAELFYAYLRARTPQEKELGLKKSSEGVLEVIRSCVKAMVSIKTFYKTVHAHLASDILIAFLFFETAAEAGFINLAGNEKMLKKPFAGKQAALLGKKMRRLRGLYRTMHREFHYG